MANPAAAHAVVSTSPRRPGTTGRHLATVLAAALIALAAWWLITSLTADRASAQILGGPGETVLPQPLEPVLAPVLAPVVQTLQSVVAPVTGGGTPVPPAITDITEPLLGQVHDALPPAVTDLTDPLLGTIGGVLPPGVLPPGVVPPELIASDPVVITPPDLPTGIGPLPGPVSGLIGLIDSLPSTDAPTPDSTISRRSGLFGPSAPSPGTVVELRLDASAPANGGGRHPALPAGPAAPISGTAGSGSHAGGAHDGPDATLAAAILMAAVGAVALSRARRPLWTDWVALAGARPG